MTTTAQSAQRREIPKPLIYRERDLKTVTNTSRKFREDAMRAGTFPMPVPLGPKVFNSVNTMRTMSRFLPASRVCSSFYFETNTPPLNALASSFFLFQT